MLKRAAGLVVADPVVSRSGEIRSRPDQEGFQQAVANTVRTIYAGDIFQTNICRKIETKLDPGQEWDLFRALRGASPAAYEAFLRVGDADSGQALLSISPEVYLRVKGRVAETEPIKGTRPRGKTKAEDDALYQELAGSEKDRAELAMIVDVSRNDLGRVSEIGSIRVEAHAEPDVATDRASQFLGGSGASAQ